MSLQSHNYFSREVHSDTASPRHSHYARKFRYVLKCDIQKYFQSIDHEILLGIIKRKIRCPKTLWLIREIIGSRNDTNWPFYFPGDDLFTPLQREKGIPIGNLTSQFFANVYLNGFDHFVKETLRVPYIRYVNDFVAFSSDRKRLQEVHQRMGQYLCGLRLKLHERKCRVYRVSEGVRFLGFRIFPHHRLLAKDNVVRMRRRLKRLSRCYREGAISLEYVHQSIQSWIAHAGHAQTYRLRGRILSEAVFQRGAAGGAPRRFLEQQHRVSLRQDSHLAGCRSFGFQGNRGRAACESRPCSRVVHPGDRNITPSARAGSD